MKASKRFSGLVLLLAVAGFAPLGIIVGCSSEPNVAALVAKDNDSNLKRVAGMYGGYQRQNGVGPKDLESFKKFIASIEPDRLQLVGIDANNLDAVFVSERDQKPIKIRFSVPGGGRMDPPNAVAFEEAGAGGKRLVAFTNSTVVEADDAKYQELWEGKTPPPAGSTESSSPPSG